MNATNNLYAAHTDTTLSVGDVAADAKVEGV